MSNRNRNRARTLAPAAIAGAPADLQPGVDDVDMHQLGEGADQEVSPMLGGRFLDPTDQADQLAAEMARMDSESPAAAAAPAIPRMTEADREARLDRLRELNTMAAEEAQASRKVVADVGPDVTDQVNSLRQLRAQTATGRRPMSRLAQGAPLPQAAPAPTRQRHGQAEQIHATQLFPELFPYPSPNRPDIWIDPKTGRPTTPRYRTGGQFAARLLIIQNTLDNRMREVGLPMAVLADHWGVEAHEQVVRHVEVVFDFEDDRDAYLKTYGRATYDPLKKNDEAPEALAGLLGPTVARAG